VRPRSVVLAFVFGAALVAFAALADRRSLLLRKDSEPKTLRAGAVFDPSWRVVVHAAYPSTFGVAVLALIGLAVGNDVLGALLGGAVAGLGIASGVGLVRLLVWERERGLRLYIASNGRRYVGPPPPDIEPKRSVIRLLLPPGRAPSESPPPQGPCRARSRRQE
jgi:hypothetical protein